MRYNNTMISYLAYALAIRRGSHWLGEECTQFGHVHLLLTSLKDEQTCGRNGKDFSRGNPSEDVKSMVIRALPMWRTFECLQVGGSGPPLTWHTSANFISSTFTPQPISFVCPPPDYYRTLQLVSRQRTAADGGSTMPDGHDGGRTRWQWQPPLSLSLAGNGSKDCESWARARAGASSNPLRKLESDVSKMAPALSPILHCTAVLSLTIAILLRLKFQFFCCEYLLMENCSAKQSEKYSKY